MISPPIIDWVENEQNRRQYMSTSEFYEDEKRPDPVTPKK